MHGPTRSNCHPWKWHGRIILGTALVVANRQKPPLEMVRRHDEVGNGAFLHKAVENASVTLGLDFNIRGEQSSSNFNHLGNTVLAWRVSVWRTETVSFAVKHTVATFWAKTLPKIAAERAIHTLSSQNTLCLVVQLTPEYRQSEVLYGSPLLRKRPVLFIKFSEPVEKNITAKYNWKMALWGSFDGRTQNILLS